LFSKLLWHDRASPEPSSCTSVCSQHAAEGAVHKAEAHSCSFCFAISTAPVLLFPKSEKQDRLKKISQKEDRLPILLSVLFLAQQRTVSAAKRKLEWRAAAERFCSQPAATGVRQRESGHAAHHVVNLGELDGEQLGTLIGLGQDGLEVVAQALEPRRILGNALHQAYTH